MRPFEPGLAREIKPVRGTIGLTAVLHVLTATLLVIQAVLFAKVVTDAFIWQRSLIELMPGVVGAGTAWAGRVLLSALTDGVNRWFGLKSVAAARSAVMSKLLATPAHLIPMPSGAVTALLTRGIEGIEVYVARYLPQLVISAIVPLGIGGVIYWLDPLSALVLVITLPLIPIFMSMVGWFTSYQVERHWQRALSVSATLQDMLAGLPELKVFGRARAQSRLIAELGQRQQAETMKVLRLSFLSALVLELLATISVAVIAVGIGLRLVNGEMELWRGLAALVLAPEVYAPLRMLGVHFHAAADGLEAWQRISRLLALQPRVSGAAQLPPGRMSAEWDELQVQVGDRVLTLPAGRMEPGRLLAVVGPSGCGKSTLIDTLLGIRQPISGTVRWRGGDESRSVADLDLAVLHRRIGFVGQDAWLGEGTAFEVVTRGLATTPSVAEVESVFGDLSLDLELNTPISDRSQGVSIGQRRRLAVARALLHGADALILDEPAAALDVETEQAVVTAVRAAADRGLSVAVVAHRASFQRAADATLDFGRTDS